MKNYEKFAEAIVTATLASDAAWTKPWKVGQAFGLPRNALTGRDYRGCNILLLLSRHFASREWLTYKQAAEMGGHVRKGQKGRDGARFQPRLCAGQIRRLGICPLCRRSGV